MAEFDINAFYTSLINQMIIAFPYMYEDTLDKSKHPKREPLHLRDAIFGNIQNTTIQAYQEMGSITFDIGNERLEQTHPYYHILQQAEVIHFPNRGTKKSKGSQAKVSNVAKRDYERVEWNGKTFTKEYSKNVRGSRSRKAKANHKQYLLDMNTGELIPVKMTYGNSYYYNVHYQYIDKMLDQIAPMLASEFGMKLKRKENTGLGEEYIAQGQDENGIGVGNILEIFDSFNY